MHDSLPVDMASPPYYRRVLTMMPHQERRFDYRLSASKRGFYQIGPMTWRTGDLLGFAPQQTGHHPPETIIVYPRVVSLDRLGAADTVAPGVHRGTHAVVRGSVARRWRT